MSAWKKVKLGEIGLIITGKTPKTSEKSFWGSGLPFITPSDDMNNKYIYSTNRQVTIKGKDSVKNCLLPPYSICFSCIGSDLGKTTITKEKAVTNQQINSIIVNKNNNVDYVYYALKNISESIKYISKTSTAVPIVNKTQFSNFEINLPPLAEQKAIADVLSALDDKIELNNKINKNLEEQAQAIFKRWFVDFEFPDENGNPYRSSGGEMHDSELGEIPKGWTVSTIEKHVQNIDNRGKTPPLSSEPTEYPIIDVKALNGNSRIINFKNCTKFVDEIVFNNFFRCGHPKELDILISTVGSLAETKLFYGNKGCIAQNVIGFRSIDISPFYLFELLRYIKNDLIAFDIGTVQPSIKVTQFNKYKIILPLKTILNNFDNLLNSLSQKIYNNEQENQKLAELRDYLLPKLMNGEIIVNSKEM